MHRRAVLFGGSALVLSGCSSRWEVAYEQGIPLSTSRDWTVTDVAVTIPEALTVSNANTYLPNADIVWHGESFGDRRAQVARILDEGITQGASALKGSVPVTLAIQLVRFHAVTPAAVANAPGAVHNISYMAQIYDNATRAPLTEPETIDAALEAYVGAAAVTAAIEGDTQRKRIVEHLARVTRGWLGAGPDQRRRFTSFGR